MSKSLSPKNFRTTVRTFHRDLGYIALSMILVYALSGILLIYRNTSFLKYDQSIEKNIGQNLSELEVSQALKFKNFKILSKSAELITFKEGSYQPQTGIASYTTQEYYFPINKVVQLHKVNGNSGHHWFTLTLGAILSFLALSAFWMYKPGTKLFNRGLILTGIGILALIALLIII